jgi:hypothetical protein
MKNRRRNSLLLWTLGGLAGVLALAWAFPRAFPLYPASWDVSHAEAEAIALARFEDLGPPVADGYVVTRLVTDALREQRLQQLAGERGLAMARQSELAASLLEWEVVVYPPGGFRQDWRYQARVGLDGTVRTLRERVPATEARPAIEEASAVVRARAFLLDQGFDLEQYGEPVVRSTQTGMRRDLEVRFRSSERLLGESIEYGVAVTFAGDRLAGFGSWYEDPELDAARRALQPAVLLNQSKILVLLVLLIVVAVFFVRRYHQGEVGVRRGATLFLLVLGAALVAMMLVARGMTEDVNLGLFTRAQQTWVWAAQLFMLFFVPMGLVAALSWSVGESFCRERWGRKLAAFDGLLQGAWRNATVSAAALRGTMGGFALAGGLLLGVLALASTGAWTPLTMAIGPWWENSRYPGVAMVLLTLTFNLYGELFGRLFVLPLAVRRFGVWVGGIAATVLSTLVFWPPLVVLPVPWALPVWLAGTGFLVVLFLRYDLLTALLASFVSQVALQSAVLLAAEDQGLMLQGALALAAVLVPFALTLRFLGSDREFEYRWEDVPPHVRRIAERERQRVELETARNIQSSILPELPEQLAGVEIAHAYLPATEVGGDFYDVLALEDGRLAVAVGDVAGHGVSSGLVMSMAKSALAVQVTFNPEVEAVFTTLNRMVYQSARKRLLATLCYLLVDPRRRELHFASAGHLVPYRIGVDGRLDAFEASSYPLGVRDSIVVRSRVARLASGDTLVLYSDGLIEARRDGSDEMFGFDRFEATLARHVGRGPRGLVAGVLRDLEDFTGQAPREDDMTLLVLRLP